MAKVLSELLALKETDPNGIGQHEPGAKLDHGKNRVDLVLSGFAHALEQVCWVGTYGAQKYTDDGWTHVPNGVSRYADAAGRHLLKMRKGEVLDPDCEKDGWKIYHEAQVIWNLLAAFELKLRNGHG